MGNVTQHFIFALLSLSGRLWRWRGGFAEALDFLPGGDCLTEEETCNMEDNIIKIASDVLTKEECGLLCEDFSCKFFTYYSSSGFPFSDTCILFSSCASLHECEGCTTEGLCRHLDINQGTCGASVEGQTGGNLISFIPNVQNETSCKSSCVSTSNCVFYTYHLLNTTMYPGGCSLLSSLILPLRECEGSCSTGPADCSSQCWFIRDGEMSSSSLLIDETRAEVSLTTVSLQPCKLTAVAVGGGGASGSSSSYCCGGGGSGNIEYASLNLTAGSTMEIKVLAGRAGGTSRVTVDGESFVSSSGGSSGKCADYNNNSCVGGSGYSGGGGGGSSHAGDGGSDGQNGGFGDTSQGGSGDGTSVESILINGFTLSPGVGGTASGKRGGGGGGVLINGKGAPGGGYNEGEGYGGGGSSYQGLSGVVILSFS